MFAGRLSPEKGVDLLLHAMTKVPGARLEIAGDGPLRAALEDLALSLGVANRVRFHGWLSQDQIADLRLELLDLLILHRVFILRATPERVLGPQ